jgi:hypothetical protein
MLLTIQSFFMMKYLQQENRNKELIVQKNIKFKRQQDKVSTTDFEIDRKEERIGK